MLNVNDLATDEAPTAEATQTPRAIAAVTTLLERLVSRNDRLATGPDHRHCLPAPAALDAFRAARPPAIGLGRYMGRIHKYTECSPSCFVVAFVYIDRLLHMYPGTAVGSLNVHRLVLAGVLVAAKVLDDEHHDNAFFARVGGVSNGELNRLELELLVRLDYAVTVSSKVFERYWFELEKEMRLREAMQKIDRPLAIMIYDGKAEALRRTLLSSQ